MDSYPEEYLVHNYPLMAVGGSAPLFAASVPEGTDNQLHQLHQHRHYQHQQQATPIQPPPEQQPPAATLASPAPNPDRASASPPTAEEPRPSLSTRVYVDSASASFYQTLLHLLTTRAARITDLPKESPMIFKVVLVDQKFLIPPRKPRNPQPGQVHAHSLLSPKNPQSPLYPDGLMLPQWVVRHREQIPSVYVGFYELAERAPQATQQVSSAVQGPLDTARDVVIGPAERQRDQMLVTEINEFKKQLIDRQIKFAAVLVLSPTQTDPLVEERIAYVRRNAGLEAKNSFFLLTQSSTDLLDFVTNLHKALFEHAVGYYREHGKRVKRKRTKLASIKDSAALSPASHLSPDSPNTGGLAPASAVSPSGSSGPTIAERWSFRYDFKAALFAEFRQDYDAAIKHLESAYVHVVDMLQPVSLLSHGATGYRVRSQRWKEAWVLADSVNFKIIKLFLLMEIPISAVTQLRKHIAIFEELWGKWRLGQTFEYWAWLSRQYHTFATVLEQVVGIGLRLPQPPFTGNNYGLLTGHQSSGADYRFGSTLVGSSTNTGAGSAAGVNPMLVLQHPGFYYHSAATCATKRWRSFMEVEAAYKRASASGHSSVDEAAWKILDEERGVDHATAVINLLTKAYEHFRLQRAGRMTLFLASEIAETHFTGGKYDVALKFFERIAKTYRKEGWSAVLTAVLSKSLACAKELKSWPAICEYTFEVLSDQSSLSKREREFALQELFQMLREPPHGAQPDEKKSTGEASTMSSSDDLFPMTQQQQQKQQHQATTPPTPESVVALTSAAESVSGDEPHRPLKRRSFVMIVDQIHTILTFSVQFRNMSASVGTHCPWQITIITGVDAPPVPLRFSALRVGFSDPKLNHVLLDPQAAPEAGGGGPVQEPDGSMARRFRGRRGREWVDCRECRRGETGDWTAAVDLLVRPEFRKVFEGKVIAQADCQELKIVMLSMVLSTPYWDLILTSKVGGKSLDSRRPRRWLEPPAEDGTIPKFTILDGTGEKSSIPVLNVEPKLQVSVFHASPAMLDEPYAVLFKMRNDELEPVEAFLRVDVRRGDKTDEGDSVSALDADGTEINAVRDVAIGTIAPGGSLDRTVHVRCRDIPGDRILTVLIRYELKPASPSGGKPSIFEKKHTLHVPFVHAFEPSFEVNSLCSGDFVLDAGLGDGPVVVLPADTRLVERVLLVCRFKCMAPWAIEVAEIQLKLPENHAGAAVAVTEMTSTSAGSQIPDHSWIAGDVHHSTFQLRVNFAERTPRQPFDVGGIMLKWRRKLPVEEGESRAQPYSSSWIPAPRIDLGYRETIAIADVPPKAIQGDPFTVTYGVANLLPEQQEYQITVDVAEGFVFSGNRFSSVRVPPGCLYRFWHTCFPLGVGKCRLPRVRVLRGKGTDQKLVRVVPLSENEFAAPGEEGISIFVHPSRGLEAIDR